VVSKVVSNLTPKQTIPVAKIPTEPASITTSTAPTVPTVPTVTPIQNLKEIEISDEDYDSEEEDSDEVQTKKLKTTHQVITQIVNIRTNHVQCYEHVEESCFYLFIRKVFATEIIVNLNDDQNTAMINFKSLEPPIAVLKALSDKTQVPVSTFSYRFKQQHEFKEEINFFRKVNRNYELITGGPTEQYAVLRFTYYSEIEKPIVVLYRYFDCPSKNVQENENDDKIAVVLVKLL